MSKKQRHERKKTERARRRRSSFHLRPAQRAKSAGSAVRDGAMALAAAAAIAGGTQAYASPVRFENPAGAGHFDWAQDGGTVVLDVTDPAAAQPGLAALPSAFEQVSFSAYYYDRIGAASFLNNAVTGVQVGGYGNYFVVGGASGDPIPSGSAWASYGFAYLPYYGGTALSEGLATYLGVRFDLGAGFQYGWIGVVRTGFELDAFAWGYETDAGVPIAAGAVPEPSSLALLAFGAGAVTTRRRRRDHVN